jgi:hypothetical protein
MIDYESPIKIAMTQTRNQLEDGILKAVRDVGIYVDKERLLRALQYDSGQYYKGYNDRDKEIIRCKYCEHATMTADNKLCKYCNKLTDDDGCPIPVYRDANYFCADGERRQ